MKLVVINIEYNKEIGNNEFDDIISITCPFKQYLISLNRTDLNDFTIADLIEEKEYELFKGSGCGLFYGSPIKFTTKIHDSDYNVLFRDFLSYTPEKKQKDLTKIFKYITDKINEIYSDVELCKKYLDGADLDGSIDGCTYCGFRHKNNYCKRFNIICPINGCCFYKFKRNKNVDKT